jgi:hypothetical protein
LNTCKGTVRLKPVEATKPRPEVIKNGNDTPSERRSSERDRNSDFQEKVFTATDESDIGSKVKASRNIKHKSKPNLTKAN